MKRIAEPDKVFIIKNNKIVCSVRSEPGTDELMVHRNLSNFIHTTLFLYSVKEPYLAGIACFVYTCFGFPSFIIDESNFLIFNILYVIAVSIIMIMFEKFYIKNIQSTFNSK